MQNGICNFLAVEAKSKGLSGTRIAEKSGAIVARNDPIVVGGGINADVQTLQRHLLSSIKFYFSCKVKLLEQGNMVFKRDARVKQVTFAFKEGRDSYIRIGNEKEIDDVNLGKTFTSTMIKRVFDEGNSLGRKPFIYQIGSPSKRIACGNIGIDEFGGRKFSPGMVGEWLPEIGHIAVIPVAR